MAKRWYAVAALLIAIATTGCAGSEGHRAATTAEQTPTLIPASDALRAQCLATAQRVGYAVPCPTRVPRGLTATAGHHGCNLEIIGAGGLEHCSSRWRGWVVGSSDTANQHLVIIASPFVVQNYAKAVNGPAWYSGARVRPLRWLRINNWRVRAIFVPPATNDGSAFASHVVLVWTARGHTYAVGFHAVRGIQRALSLDVALARGIKLVGP
jgi:hypothetical protein